jgi:hypothetical protein
MALSSAARAPGKGFRMKPRHVLGGTIVALLLIAGGWVMAASFSITQGPTETGSGVYHGTASLAYFPETGAGVGTQPGSLPTQLWTTVGTPTVLAGSATNYAVNAPTLNDIAHFWKFTEATSAPVSTELEIQFTVSTGGVPTITSVVVYVETQSTAPGAEIVFTVYYDLGSPSAGTITLNSVTEVGEQCSAVGTCP